MQTVGDRLRRWIQVNHLTIGGVERVSGLGNATLKNIQSPSATTLKKIKDKYVTLDLDYIINGNDPKGIYEGEELSFRVESGSARVLEYNPQEINVEELLEENKMLREQIEKLSKKENTLLSVLDRLSRTFCGDKPNLEDLEKLG